MWSTLCIPTSQVACSSFLTCSIRTLRGAKGSSSYNLVTNTSKEARTQIRETFCFLGLVIKSENWWESPLHSLLKRPMDSMLIGSFPRPCSSYVSSGMGLTLALALDVLMIDFRFVIMGIVLFAYLKWYMIVVWLSF